MTDHYDETDLPAIVKRIEALEKQPHVDSRAFALMAKHVEDYAKANADLQARIGKEESDNAAWRVERVEEVRVARWHATYNAVRGGMEAATVELLDVDDSHEYAAEAADRAHGPLEAEPPGDPNIFIGSSPLQVYVAHVDALVKAVQEACDYALPEEAMALLTNAVEPFEEAP